MTKVAIFASGTGTNFDALVEAMEKGQVDAQCVLLVCDHPEAPVVEKAKRKGIPSFTFQAKAYPSKEAYEKEILEKIKLFEVEWIVCAGYMRILGPTLLDAYPSHILNIHPSLLPAFKGKDAIGQAFRYGVKVMGVSIHYVNAEMDGGAVIAQEAFAVPEGSTEEDVEQRIHAIEHVLYPKTLQALLKKEEGK